MRLRLEMSGGFGGLFTTEPLVCDIDTDALPPAEGEELLALVDASGLVDATPPEPSAAVRDTFQYRLQLVHDTATKTMTFDDTTVPPRAQPLLTELRRRAIESRQQH